MAAAKTSYANADTLKEIVRDSTGNNAILPAGLPSNTDWYHHGRQMLGNNPGDLSYGVAWGTVYSAQGTKPNPDIEVDTRDLDLWVLSKSTGKWSLYSAPRGIWGNLYSNLATDTTVNKANLSHIQGEYHTTLNKGTCFQLFFNGYRAKLDPNDIAGIVVSYEAKISSISGRSVASSVGDYIANAGMDYWRTETGLWNGLGVSNEDAFVGSFTTLTGDYQKIYGTTLTLDQLMQNPPPAGLNQIANSHALPHHSDIMSKPNHSMFSNDVSSKSSSNLEKAHADFYSAFGKATSNDVAAAITTAHNNGGTVAEMTEEAISQIKTHATYGKMAIAYFADFLTKVGDSLFTGNWDGDNLLATEIATGHQIVNMARLDHVEAAGLKDPNRSPIFDNWSGRLAQTISSNASTNMYSADRQITLIQTPNIILANAFENK